MKLGIDLRPLQGETQFRGIGKALQAVLGELSLLNAKNVDFIFYVDEGLPVPGVIKSFPDGLVIKIPTSRIGRTKYIRSVLPSYRPAEPKPRDTDVFLQFDAALGVPVSVPTITVFYDLIPFIFHGAEKKQRSAGARNYKNMLSRKMHWGKYLRNLSLYQKSRKIIAISESSANDLRRFVPGCRDIDISVVHLGVDTKNSTVSASATVKDVCRQPFLLYVGGIDYRKNIIALLRSFYELKTKYPALRLVVVGKEFELTKQLDDLGWSKLLNSNENYAKDVIIPGYVSADELNYIYSQASAFVFPSLYEGFGLPIIEAMQSGCPVIAYDNSSIPEVAGDAAYLIKDGESLTAAIQKLLDDKAFRSGLIERGKNRAQEFSWESTAKNILKIAGEVGRSSQS